VFACVVPLSYSCYRSDIHEAFLRGGVYPVFDLVHNLYEVADRKASRSYLRRPARLLLRSHQAFLASIVSSWGALADSLSTEMSSRYQSTRFSEVLASSAAMNTL
jgi:hypothetical protein